MRVFGWQTLTRNESEGGQLGLLRTDPFTGCMFDRLFRL